MISTKRVADTIAQSLRGESPKPWPDLAYDGGLLGEGEHGRAFFNCQNVAEKVLAKRSRKVTPGDPGEFCNCDMLPNGCPNIVEQLLRKPGMGPSSTELGQIRRPAVSNV